LKARPVPFAPYLRALSLTVVLVAAFCDPSIAQEPEAANRPRRLRVVTWNIHGCASGIQGVIEQLQRLHPDLVCLQEAEAAPAADNIRQPQAIAEALGMRQYSAGSKLPNGREQRMAILLRGDIDKPEPLEAGTGRIYGVTGLIRLNSTEIRVVCLHLTGSYRTEIRHLLKTSAARSREAQHLAALVQSWSSPTIVVGDFNSAPGMVDHDAIARRLRAAPTTRPTYPSDRPLLAIDHVYVPSPMRIESLSTQPTTVSDHLPLIAVIAFGPHGGSAPASSPLLDGPPMSSGPAPWRPETRPGL